MRGINDLAIKLALDTLYFSGIHHVMAPATAGLGAIFALHRVRPRPLPGDFAPNQMLEIAPDFLDAVLKRLRKNGVDIVDLDEAAKRLEDGSDRRFVVFTFDDGYADSYREALPIFAAYDAPYTIYVTTGLIDGIADIWWLALEEAIARLTHVKMQIGDDVFDLPARNGLEKQAVWDAVYWPLRDLSIAERRAIVVKLAREAGMSDEEIGRTAAMDWDQVREAARGKLVAIGAHTVHHLPVRDLSESDARFEMLESKNRLEKETGVEVRHFAYPFGNPESAGPREFALSAACGFRTAVTMRRGPVFAEHGRHLHALPRVSLNGNFQSLRYVDLFLSGAPFALWNKGKKLNVA